jgi:hypothetical protein
MTISKAGEHKYRTALLQPLQNANRIDVEFSLDAVIPPAGYDDRFLGLLVRFRGEDDAPTNPALLRFK